MDQHIRNRQLSLCPSTADWPVAELVKECPDCHAFVLYCFSCHQRQLDLGEDSEPPNPCHYFRIVFTDGACLGNGQPGATSGVGVALGAIELAQLSIPITDSEDPSPVRSNQRAELYAVMAGLKCIAELHRSSIKEPSDESLEEPTCWIIASDSEYVVKGVTEWLPEWKKNNWRTSKGTVPENLDLFRALDEDIEKHENQNIQVGLWRISREDNELADLLAKLAAVDGTTAAEQA